VPAGVYLALQHGAAGEGGWGVPMATDIAFAVGFLALLGSRVPLGLKVLLLSLAIVDDLGAVLVIAVAYTEQLSLLALGLALAGFGAVVLLRAVGVRAVPVYVLVGALVWLGFLKSGVHPTVAGVLLGLLTPSRPWLEVAALREAAAALLGDDAEPAPPGVTAAHRVAQAARETVPPLERLETALHPWVAFVIMPIFALANAGVPVDPAGLGDPVAVAVALGLCVGKPVGIFAFSWAAVRVGLARLPAGVTWPVLAATGVLAGIGFTMSLFIAGLALEGDLLTAGKVGTLAGSAVSAAVGLALLAWLLPPAGEGPA
jgi:NhaA family Na+:H+ antiporter